MSPSRFSTRQQEHSYTGPPQETRCGPDLAEAARQTMMAILWCTSAAVDLHTIFGEHNAVSAVRRGFDDRRRDECLQPLFLPDAEFQRLSEAGGLAGRILYDVQHVQREFLRRRPRLRAEWRCYAGGNCGDGSMLPT